MNRKQLIDKLVSRLKWQPLQVYLKHYQSAEIDLSAIAVAYYLLLTAFPLIVIAANIFPYLNIDISVLLSFMEKIYRPIFTLLFRQLRQIFFQNLLVVFWELRL